MLHQGLAFDYVPSDAPPPAAFLSKSYAAYVVSDYPAARFGPAAMTHVAEAVLAGRRPGDAGRLGEFFRPTGGIPPVAAGQRVARAHAAKRRSPQLCSALPDPEDGRSSDAGRIALGRAAGNRRLQCADGKARRGDAARSGAIRGPPERRRVRVRPRPSSGRCWSSASTAGDGRRRWRSTWRRTGSAGWSTGAIGGSSRRWPARRSRSATGTSGFSAICWPGRASSAVPSPAGRGQGEGSCMPREHGSSRPHPQLLSHVRERGDRYLLRKGVSCFTAMPSSDKAAAPPA